jgi:tRNA modification GTPase
MPPPPADTIAALATPPGAAALAVIRISGPDTPGLAREILGALPPPRSARLGAYRDRGGALLDRALFTFFPAPRSYTGEDLLEISAHGSPYLAQRLLADLFARGCRPAGPGEFTQRAFLHGRIDLSQAEAVMDVIRARGERALAAAQRLLAGELGRGLRPLVDGLVGALARVEAAIDFPEEDLPPEDREGLRAALAPVREGTGRLLATRRTGELLRGGIRTVIVGAPNAGKSSLLNRLVGRERAIVSGEPGTTRDYLEESVLLGPHQLRLVDTAGLNPAPGAVERLGLEKTWEQIDAADLLILVLDASLPSPPLDERLRARLRPGAALAVLNKIDLSGGAPAAQAPAGLERAAVSAATGEGMDGLAGALVRLADGLDPEGSAPGIAINARHAHALERARDGLDRAAAQLAAGAPAELVASELRGALDAFGEIGGRIDHERILDRLFADFCIGK